MSGFGWVQGYNAQAAINEIGIIVAAEVFDSSSDKDLFAPMLAALESTAPPATPATVRRNISYDRINLLDARYRVQCNCRA